MAKPSEQLTFRNGVDGKTLSDEELRFFIVNTSDREGLRDLAFGLLQGMGRMHRSQTEYRTQMRQWTDQLQQQMEVLLRTTAPSPPQAPVVKIEPGAVVLNVSPPAFTFEAGALALDMHQEAARTGVILEYDEKGRVVGTSPKPAAP